MDAALARIEAFVDAGGRHLVATVNPEFVMRANDDKEFARVLESAALCIADGSGIVCAVASGSTCSEPLQVWRTSLRGNCRNTTQGSRSPPTRDRRIRLRTTKPLRESKPSS